MQYDTENHSLANHMGDAFPWQPDPDKITSYHIWNTSIDKYNHFKARDLSHNHNRQPVHRSLSNHQDRVVSIYHKPACALFRVEHQPQIHVLKRDIPSCMLYQFDSSGWHLSDTVGDKKLIDDDDDVGVFIVLEII